jgi:farnesyl-diphosphate farnesyltransferase
MYFKEQKFCEAILTRVSRSFALTIPMLDEEIYFPVMLSYLQDRLLDNFEDEIRDISIDKQKELMDRVVDIFNPYNFHPESSIKIIRENAYRIKDDSLRELTENADLLRRSFESLEDVIKDFSFKWLLEMNKGMKKYLDKEINTFKELNEYSYYVAGTVGGFLTDLIILKSSINDEHKKELLHNFIDAGLFLQKVNLVRDISKDIKNRDKNFWPLNELGLSEKKILDPIYREEAMLALNRMIEDIKLHIEALIRYKEALPANLPGYKRFFTVNNALGLATVEKMDSNPAVFYNDKKVKVSKIEFLSILKNPEHYFNKKCKPYLITKPG